jgi:hypothetical protein
MGDRGEISRTLGLGLLFLGLAGATACNRQQETISRGNIALTVADSLSPGANGGAYGGDPPQLRYAHQATSPACGSYDLWLELTSGSEVLSDACNPSAALPFSAAELISYVSPFYLSYGRELFTVPIYDPFDPGIQGVSANHGNWPVFLCTSGPSSTLDVVILKKDATQSYSAQVLAPYPAVWDTVRDLGAAISFAGTSVTREDSAGARIFKAGPFRLEIDRSHATALGVYPARVSVVVNGTSVSATLTCRSDSE